MDQSAKTAVGGILVGLSVIILMPTIIGAFVYALPVIASVLILFSVIELGKGWAAGIYAAVSILGLLFVPNKEAVIYYVAFFGYYPIVKAILESKNMPRILEYFFKFLVFNVSMILSVVILVKIFGMPLAQIMDTEGETGFFAKYAVYIMLGLGNIVFPALDFVMGQYADVYLRVWQKRLKKMFPFLGK